MAALARLSAAPRFFFMGAAELQSTFRISRPFERQSSYTGVTEDDRIRKRPAQ
jgi:hypothetical protein